MGSTWAAAKFGQNAAPENETAATNSYNTDLIKKHAVDFVNNDTTNLPSAKAIVLFVEVVE